MLKTATKSNLTTGQFRIWTGQKLDPNRPLYNMALSFHIQGKLQLKFFRMAYQALVDRSDALRTVFFEEDGLPRQHVMAALDYQVLFKDFSSIADPHLKIQSWTQKRAMRTFDMDKPLFESVLLKIADTEFVWFLNQHHLITDGWSCAILYQKMSEFYQMALDGTLNNAPQLALYREYQKYEHEFKKTNSFSTAAAYWKEKQSTVLPAMDLYGVAPSATATQSKRFLFDIGRRRTDALRALASDKDFQSFSIDLSLFNIFAALLYAFLFRISGNTKLVIATPSHHRPTAKFKETIGLFIELFPMEINIVQNGSFRSLINAIAPESYDFLKNALPGTSGTKSGNVFSAVLNYINTSFSDFCGMPMQSTWIHPDHVDRGHFLRLQVHDFDMTGSIQLHFDMADHIFNHDLGHRAIGHFIKLLDALLQNPDQPIAQIDLQTEDEKNIILQSNQTDTPIPKDMTVVHLLMEQFAATGRAGAVVEKDTCVSYQDLDEQSDRVACRLRNAGATRDTMVAVYLERSIELIVTLVGVLKAGAAFVPIDTAFPKKRIAYILEDCKAPIILTQKKLQDRIPNSSAKILSFDQYGQTGQDHLPDVFQRQPDTHDLAYVIYTSGSTGQPKGVMIEHGSLVNYLLWARKQYMHDGAHDFPLFSTIAADLTVTSIFLPLISGGKIIIYRESSDGVDLSIMDVFKQDAVDIIKLTPSHLTLLVGQKVQGKRLKKLIVGGEDFKSGLAQQVFGLFNGRIEIFNEYGPTEATVGCMIHCFDPAYNNGRSVAIGKPIDNLRIHLLDSRLNPVPMGVKGHMYIAGKGLARGYLNREQLTSKMFIDSPFRRNEKMYDSGDVGRYKPDGVLEFFGRKDHQVKVRGFRIEPGEIASALLDISGINESFVNVVDLHSSEASQDVQNCRICGISSNHPQAKLDGQNVCRICRIFEKQKNTAQLYFKTEDDFARIVAHAKKTKKGKYDAIMLYSGGKDSTYALYQLVEMGMHPLVFSFDNGFISDDAKENIRRVVDDLNLDLVWGKTPAMNAIFVDSLRRFSNVCNGCQKVINTLGVNLAREKGIGYIFTGLSRGQFFETRVAELFSNEIFSSEEIDQNIIAARKAYHRMNDAVSKHLDVSVFADDAIFEQIQFVDFYRYCDVKLDDLLAFLDKHAPWIRPSDTGRSTNCLINEAGIYVHKKERGFHNYELPYSWDVRLGHKDRESALEELDDDIDEHRVKKMLDFIGYDSEEKTIASSDRRIIAYYISDSEFSSEELRTALSKTLPAYMIPVHFIRMATFPLNATGKTDSSALPLPEENRMGLPDDYVAPRNKTEHVLVDIWAKVLGLDKVGIYDNFFDLGGDSILSIQIVAQAAKLGLDFSPGLVFEYSTVADLSTNIAQRELTDVEHSKTTGSSVPLTPIQQWFFKLKLSKPHIWNMTLKLDVSKKISPIVIENAFRNMVNHHDSLRLRFKQNQLGWRQYLSEDQNAFHLEHFDLTKTPAHQHSHDIEQAMQKAQTSLNLEYGPLIKVLFFQKEETHDNLLGLIVHHLAVDGVSWYILLEDLETLCLQLSADKAPVLPPKTTSFGLWADKLMTYANSPDGQIESDYWISFLKKPVTPIPRDFELGGNGLESSAQTIIGRLDRHHTKRLLNKATLAVRMSVDELLMGALMQTLCHWSGHSSIRFDKEGHGREGVIKEVALYRTLGWFTSIYPVHLSLPEGYGLGEILGSVKSQVRTIPHHGFGFAPLYYLNNNRDIHAALKQIWAAEVSFNYLGTLNQITGQSSLFRLNGPLQGVRDPQGQRPYLLEINAFVMDGQLEVYWTFSSEHHKSTTIEKLSNAFLSNLSGLINHCLKLSGHETESAALPAANLDTDKFEQTNEIEARYPLSPLQAGILFHTLKAPGSGVYVEQYDCTFTGRFHQEHFQNAWQSVVRLHPALRTAFFWDDLQDPYQIVRHTVDLDWCIKDLTVKSEEERSKWLNDYLQHDRKRGFSLDQAPLMRFGLFQVDADKFYWVWSFHHLLFDGWSTPMIIQQVYTYYHHLCKGETAEIKPSRPFQDFIAWLQKQDLVQAESFWKQRLRSFTEPTPISIRQFQQGRSGYDQKEVALPHQLTTELISIAKRKRLTLNTIIQGAWAVLLHRYSDRKDIVFGATVSGRPPVLEDVERMIGLFINTLPVRAVIEPDLPMAVWLTKLMKREAKAREFDYTPLPKVQAWCELQPGVPLFDTIVVFENYPVFDAIDGLVPELSISDVTYREQSNYPLSLLVVPGKKIRLMAVYDRSLFTDNSILCLLDHMKMLLTSFAANPDQLMKNLSILSESERLQLSQWTGADKILQTQQPVHRMFEDQVVQHTERYAVIDSAQRFTYEAINHRANRLAHYLLYHGGGLGTVYGIYIDRSMEMIAAILAVLKSGSAYVPLDPTYPDKRISFIIADAGIEVVLTLKRLAGVFSKTSLTTIMVDTGSLKAKQYSEANPDPKIRPNDLAYIIYTSGSTGTAKGVMISHGNLTHTTQERIRYYNDVPERFLLLSSISFDSSVAGIFGTLCRGGSLYIPHQKHFRDVGYIARLIAKHGITHTLTIPSFYQHLLQHHHETVGSLKSVIVAGEPCPHDLVKAHLSLSPDVGLYNEYGPTEVTVWCTVFDCRQNYASTSVPIGRPIGNTTVYVLDKHLRQVPPGITGELYVGGLGISIGYLNRPEMTADRFIENPLNHGSGEKLYKTGDMVRFIDGGVIEFIGRNDDQIKIRGYRIEPGEIESVLLSIDAVLQAVVVPNHLSEQLPEQTGVDDDQSIKMLADGLNTLGQDHAEQILSEIENTHTYESTLKFPVDSSAQNIWKKNNTHFNLSLQIKAENFIHPPRANQRKLLIRQILDEFTSDLEHLDEVSKKFVIGRTTHLTAFDISQSKLDGDRIMEDWQIPIMKVMAQYACETNGDLLEIGFGRGIASSFIQNLGVRSHTIIESNKNIIQQFFIPWKEKYPKQDIRLIQGRWQDVLDQSEMYDAVFFHAFPMNEEEFAEYILNSIIFAEHFFPTAERLLKPGGVFTYLTTEIDSLSRRHQRALFEHFSSITLQVQPLSVPENTIDTWWADKMVIVKVIK